MTNDMLDGIGTIVEKIDINQLDSKLDACIQDVKTIASFSWMDTAAPTIQVPGRSKLSPLEVLASCIQLTIKFRRSVPLQAVRSRIDGPSRHRSRLRRSGAGA